MNYKIIIVTGYFGAPIYDTAAGIASGMGYTLFSLDNEIVRRDGRSISRICMMGGEHAYRNAEYEILDELADDPGEFAGGSPGIVVSCGDEVLYDDMSREIIDSFDLMIVGGDMTADELWQNARKLTDTYHAFMKFGSDEEKHAAFLDFHARQKAFFNKIKQNL